ncbi:MAG: TolC family protein [Flammeovirgaceae bacterium]|jgi:outer membrane protein, heavy metal efflux system|nr:TolC family protein [Flammeovirgaceae bacterium]
MKKYIILLFASVTWSLTGAAQTNVDNVISQIARNNKSILATQQYWDAQDLQYKTGLTPNNPKVEYDYLPGRPDGAGTQEEFNITQAFDFPTAYGKKNKVSEQQVTQSTFQMMVVRQDILLEAKQVCLELIYLNKINQELTNRLAQVEKVRNSFQEKLAKGEGNILDVNKANLQLITLKSELESSKSSMKQWNHKLTELNGGIEIAFNEAAYSGLPVIPELNELDSIIEANNPIAKVLQQEKVIAQQKIELSKSMALPKIEAGYHAQSILGQRYQGAHIGLSIPLWENKNRVKFQQATFSHSDLKLQEHKTEHSFYIKQLYEKYQNLKSTVEEYNQVLLKANNSELLNKALQAGQISSIEYFMELSYFYAAYDKLLIKDKELQKTVAELYKFQL